MNVPTSVDAVVCVQLVFQAELFGTVLTLVWLPRFVLLMGLLLGNITGSIETTSPTGLICAEKNKTHLRIFINSNWSKKIVFLDMFNIHVQLKWVLC